ncbi:proline-rich protein 36 [Procambarus clarkii]|uniref:proline-rich protein 36 n=1 Tax=Procambarus clarkii TaxID=6728 RepID=UPI0037427BED
MPCSCFGKKDKKCGVAAEEKYRPRDSNSREREPPSVAAPSQAPPPAATLPPQPPLTPTAGGDARLRPEDDPDKANRRRDVVASFYSDQCELIGFKATGSRPPSTHVGSTVDGPAATSSPAASSPGSTRSAASCRAELAEKRREFFKQLTLEDDNSSCGGGSRPISRLTDPGCHTTPRHSHYQDPHLHHSLPHPPKPTARALKYSLPLTPSPPASEETQPLLQPTNQEDDEEITGSREAPQVPAGASEPPGQGWGVVEAPACVVEPPQDIPQQTHRPGSSSSTSADQSSSEVAREPLLQLSAETLGEDSVWQSPEQRDGEPPTGGRSQELIRVSSPTDLSQLLADVSHPVMVDIPTDDKSQVLVSVSTTVVEDSSTSDRSLVDVSVPSSVVILNSSEAVISEHLAEAAADTVNTAAAAGTVNTAAAAGTVNTAAEDTVNTAAAEDTVNTAAAADTVNTAAAEDTVNPAAAADTVNTAAAAGTVNTAAEAGEQSQLCVEELHYVHQTSVQSDDERVAEGSCILIDDAFPAQPQEAAGAGGGGNNHTSPSPPPHLQRHNRLAVEDELSQGSHISTTPQELPPASTDEGYDEVSRQTALHSDFLDTSQHDTEVMVADAVVRPELEEVVLNNHQEPVHQALSFTVDPYFLTSAEEPEELQIDHMLHQSGSQLEEKHLPKQRPQLPEVSLQHHSQAKSTVEIVECIPKVPPPLESTLPLGAASSHLNTIEAPLTATTPQGEVEPLPPAPPTPPFEDEPLPPPPPTPPLLDEPLPPAPPTPPISSEPRLPPATCGTTHLSSSVLEDDGLGSEIDDALSSLECLSEEGNRNERAAAS